MLDATIHPLLAQIGFRLVGRTQLKWVPLPDELGVFCVELVVRLPDGSPFERPRQRSQEDFLPEKVS